MSLLTAKSLKSFTKACSTATVIRFLTMIFLQFSNNIMTLQQCQHLNNVILSTFLSVKVGVYSQCGASLTLLTVMQCDK
jgi:hypothetical protein